MSTNQELVLRAEQAAKQVAQDKADIQAMVTKLEQVQAPAIASAKENIKQALIEKGQTVDDSVPFSEYGNKVRAISSGGTTGGGEDFYRCAEVFGTNVIKYLKVSNAIDEVNGDYEETEIIKNGEPVYSKVSPNANSYYIYYIESDWDSGWVINNNMNENSLEYSLYYAWRLIGDWYAGEPLGCEGGANTSFYHAIINQGQAKTWSGYKLTLTENGYLEDSTLTTGLLYGVGDTSDYVTNSIVPKKNKIYNSSCTVELENIKIADDFITFTAEEPFSKINLGDYNGTADISGLKYSFDGKTWLPYQKGFEIILYNVGDNVKFKDTNPNRTTKLGKFSLSGKIACTGELNSLVNGKLDWHEGCFKDLFFRQEALTTAPSITFNTLGFDALGDTFWDCKKLKRIRFNVKELNDAFRSMQSVVLGCNNLSVIEVDFKNWGQNEQTERWCEGVSSTGVFVKPSELPLEYGTSRIPEGWIVINK